MHRAVIYNTTSDYFATLPHRKVNKGVDEEMYVFLFYSFPILLIHIQDPKDDNKQFHVVAIDMVKSISELWDNLPIDTVIASILDPRVKFFDPIPKSEINEALKIMATVCFLFIMMHHFFSH